MGALYQSIVLLFCAGIAEKSRMTTEMIDKIKNFMSYMAILSTIIFWNKNWNRHSQQNEIIKTWFAVRMVVFLFSTLAFNSCKILVNPESALFHLHEKSIWTRNVAVNVFRMCRCEIHYTLQMIDQTRLLNAIYPLNIIVKKTKMLL